MALTRLGTDQLGDGIVTNAKINASAAIAGSKLADDLTYGSNLTVSGNLTVNGTTTDVSTVNTQIEDNVIMLNQGESGAAITETYAGLSVDRGSSANAHMVFDDGQDRWEFLTGNDTIASASLGNVAFGTVGAGTWQGTAVADAYVANDLTISGGTVNLSLIHI